MASEEPIRCRTGALAPSHAIGVIADVRFKPAGRIHDECGTPWVVIGQVPERGSGSHRHSAIAGCVVLRDLARIEVLLVYAADVYHVLRPLELSQVTVPVVCERRTKLARALTLNLPGAVTSSSVHATISARREHRPHSPPRKLIESAPPYLRQLLSPDHVGVGQNIHTACIFFNQNYKTNFPQSDTGPLQSSFSPAYAGSVQGEGGPKTPRPPGRHAGPAPRRMYSPRSPGYHRCAIRLMRFGRLLARSAYLHHHRSAAAVKGLYGTARNLAAYWQTTTRSVSSERVARKTDLPSCYH